MAGRARIFEVKETRVFVQDRGRLERGERKLPSIAWRSEAESLPQRLRDS
jgi:hypothetical protein